MSFLLEKKLNRWVEAKVIDEKTRSDILLFEDSGSRLNILNAAMAIGALAIIIGVISVVAANWFLIPKYVKLGSNLTWLVVLAGGIYYSSQKKMKTVQEVTILIFFGAILSSIAIIGQVFHLESHPLAGISFWLLLGTPILFYSHTKYPAFLWSVVLSIWSYYLLDYFLPESMKQIHYTGLLPLILFYVAIAIKETSLGNKYFSVATYKSGLFLFFSIVMFLGSERWKRDNSYLFSFELFIVSLASLPLGYYFFKKESPKIAAIFMLMIGFLEIPHFIPHSNLELVGAIYFIGLSAFIASWAVKENRKRIFDLCCLVIALRIIIIYFEVFGSLLDTGIGLICSGCFILFIAYLWHSKKDKLWFKGKS